MRLLGFVAACALLGCPGVIAGKRNTRRNHFSIISFGGIADGLTDNGPAFRRAFAALAAHGGGKLDIPTAAEPYVVTTADSVLVDGFKFIASIPSNVHITGKGTIKLGDSVNSAATPAGSHDFGIQMFGNVAGASDIEIDGITLDMNGVHNLQPAGSEVHSQYGFRFTAHGAYAGHIAVHDIVIKNCAGNNMIVFQGAGGRFASIIECKLFAGGKGIAANVNNVDFSFVYTQWRKSRINHNVICQSPVNTGASGGIELHNADSEAIGNTITNCYPGILLESNPAPITNVSVTKNVMTGGFSGISLWGGSAPFRTVRISDNRITLKHNRALAMTYGESYGIGQPFLAARSRNTWTSGTANGVSLESLVIVRNVIAMDTAVASANNISMGITLNGCRDVLIAHNTIKYMSSSGINLYGSIHGAASIRVERNRLIDCGNNTTMFGHSGISLDFTGSTSAAKWEHAIYSGHTIEIFDNYIGRLVTSGRHYGISMQGTANVTGITQEHNRFVNVSHNSDTAK